MNNELFDALELLEKEKGISKDYMLERIEAALVSAYKREYGSSNCKVIIDSEKKDLHMYQEMTVVEEVTDPLCEFTIEDARRVAKHPELGQVCLVEMKPKTFRRLSAQTAKQVIIQGIREAERGLMIKEYEDKKEEIITATVERIDPETGNVTVDTGTSKASLLSSELIPGETVTEGQHIKVFVTEVRKESARGPIVTLSRIHPGLVKRLFELEVPEIQDGTVRIMNVIREAGSRTKMSVVSVDENVDPIGSCIGPKGSRINSIVEELNGEKIDIIKYSDNPAEYIEAALSPATVREVTLDGEKSSRVIVDSDQLSLAIGKEGQNVRLAARLTGFKIDIKVD